MIHEMTSSAADENTLTDLFSRTISYLRLSLTDRCNLRCRYCVGEDEASGGLVWLSHEELLTYEELLRVVRVAVGMGITKVRLTGGEPLVRRGVLGFIRELTRIEGLDDVRLTTNGVLLAQSAAALRTAGVTKVNVSLDSLRPERVAEINGVDCFAAVWRGIQTVLALGFASVKVNMVVMRHINDDEVLDFARLTQHLPLQVRYIEFMPIGSSNRWTEDTCVGSDEIMERIASLGQLIPQEEVRSDGPARVFRLAGAVGSLGFISPISHHFCDRCNRLRLTSNGSLRSCLLHDDEVDLRAVLRSPSCEDATIRAALLTAIRNKPQGHHLRERLASGGDCHGRMSRIGG